METKKKRKVDMLRYFKYFIFALCFACVSLPASDELFIAAYNNDLTAVESYITQGGDIFQRAEGIELDEEYVEFMDEATALMIAAVFNSNDVAEFLIKNYPNLINIQDTMGRTALFYSALAKNYMMFDMLLENGADVKLNDQNGMILFSIVALDDLKLIEILISHRIDMNQFSNNISLLSFQALNGSVEITKLILTAGAKFVNDGSDIPIELYLAALNGNVEFVRFFIDQNIPFNLDSDTGQNFLKKLSERGENRIIEILMMN
jgi:ankyrin repeat protein